MEDKMYSRFDYSTIRGHIPETLAVYCQLPRNKNVPYMEKDGKVVFESNEIQVIPAFAVDNENENRKKTAYEWARCYDRQTHTYLEPVVSIRPNTPISGVRICDLESRDEGGRAYKVIMPNNELYDLREDVLLDAIYELGIAPGGILGGEYLWAVVGSQMKLIRNNSRLHKKLIETGELKKITTKIGAKEWVPGDIYNGKNNEPKMFLGWVDGIEFKENYYRAGKGQYEAFKRKPLWLGIAPKNIDVNPFEKMFEEFKNNHVYGCHLERPTNLVTKLGHYDIPENFFEELHSTGIRSFEEAYKAWSRDGAKPGWSPYWRLRDCFLRPTGEPVGELSDEIIQFCKNEYDYMNLYN